MRMRIRMRINAENLAMTRSGMRKCGGAIGMQTAVEVQIPGAGGGARGRPPL